MQLNDLNLVADIGGTNARFALARNALSDPIEPRNLICADYENVSSAVHAYLAQVGFGAPSSAAISIATPVTGDEIGMMNHNWRFSVKEIRDVIGVRHLKVLNDYTSLALAIPHLDSSQCVQVGVGEVVPKSPKAVLGPGTGLGVSGVVWSGQHWVPLQSEGGHITYGGVTDRERAIVQFLSSEQKHISAECLVSGPGLSLIYDVILQLDGHRMKKLNPSDVSNLAIEQKCEKAAEALSLFCEILGTVAGNLALTMGARGGVYIGGGIVPKILDYFRQSGFRDRFEQHGRLTDYLKTIPTYVINMDYPALKGATVALSKHYDSVGISSHIDE